MRLLAVLSLSLLPLLVQASDADNGHTLHQDNCVSCHVNMAGGDGSALYTRDARRVTSLEKLGTQVRFCESNLGLRWFDEDVDDVVAYLNKAYYHFNAE